MKDPAMKPSSELGTVQSDVLPDASKSHDELANTEKDEESIALAAILERNSSEKDTHEEASRDIDNQIEEDLGTVQISDTATINDSYEKAVSPLADASTHVKDIQLEHEARETTTTQEPESLTAQNVQTTLETHTTNETPTTQEIPDKEPEIQNTTDASSTDVLSTSRQDSTDSTDVYRNSPELLRLDSHEEESPRGPETNYELKTSEPLPKDQHVPILADTWSRRSLPTSYAIEHLAVSKNYVFCIDSRGRVYFSDPNTASNMGWEKADFKAKEIFVNSACDFISYIEQGKAYVRVNINDTNPVGNDSCQILDDVSLLTTCSSCTWAVTAGNTLRRADTAKLAKLKSGMKCNLSWKIEDSKDCLEQIVCYDTVLWGRFLDETLMVYPGKYERLYSLAFMYLCGMYSTTFIRDIYPIFCRI